MNAPEPAARRNPFSLLMHIPVPWVYVIGFLIGSVLEYGFPLRGNSSLPPGVKWAGTALFCLGAAIAASGLVTFWKARTTTVPGQISARLVTWGPYRFSRNPMYVGLTLAYLGEAGIILQTWPVLLLPLVLIYVNGVVIPVEERMLMGEFGEAYEAYRARVRRWI